MAVNRCLTENILSDVLKANRKEVVGMFLEEYDQELHYKTLRDEGFDDGYDDGQDRINDLNKHLVQDNRIEDLLKSVNDQEYQKELLKEYGL